MKSKQQTPLGYLMALLDVSLADLGDYLYVAQTSISKWKTGARPLKTTSAHFAGIVEYFAMLARDPQRRSKLVQLFARLYPEQPADTSEDLAASIHAFLDGKLLPSVTLQEAMGDEGKLYTAQVSVYGSADGCAAAFRQMTAFLAGQPPCQVWAVNLRDEGLPARLLPALRRGHRLRLLLRAPAPGLLVGDLAAVLAHPLAETRLLAEDAPLAPREVRYLVGDELLLMGFSFPGHAPYAAMYTDAMTIEQHRHAFEALWAAARPAFEGVELARLGQETYRHARETTLDERTDWLLPGLPYVTMSRALLMEVLRANNVSGRVWTHMLASCDELAGERLRLLAPASALRAPRERQAVLSMLCGQEIRLTREQAVRHMLDTAALLRADGGLSLVPVQGEMPEVWRSVSAYVKRNAYAGYLGMAEGTVRIARSPRLVAPMAAAMDALAKDATPEAAMPGYVAGLLERAALGGGAAKGGSQEALPPEPPEAKPPVARAP